MKPVKPAKALSEDGLFYDSFVILNYLVLCSMLKWRFRHVDRNHLVITALFLPALVDFTPGIPNTPPASLKLDLPESNIRITSGLAATTASAVNGLKSTKPLTAF